MAITHAPTNGVSEDATELLRRVLTQRQTIIEIRAALADSEAALDRAMAQLDRMRVQRDVAGDALMASLTAIDDATAAPLPALRDTGGNGAAIGQFMALDRTKREVAASCGMDRSSLDDSLCQPTRRFGALHCYDMPDGTVDPMPRGAVMKWLSQPAYAARSDGQPVPSRYQLVRGATDTAAGATILAALLTAPDKLTRLVCLLAEQARRKPAANAYHRAAAERARREAERKRRSTARR